MLFQWETTSHGVSNEPLQRKLPNEQRLLIGFHIDPSYLHLYTSGWTPNVHFLEEWWWLLSQKPLTLAQMIYSFYWAIFASGLKTDFQPASIQRPVLHLDPWVTYLSMHLPRIPGHVKGSKYHTLIDSESYFLPLRSLRISMRRLTKWGGVRADSQELLCRRPCPSSQAPRSQGVKVPALQGKMCPCDAPMSIIWVSESSFEGILVFRFDKNRKTFRKKIGFVCKWRIFLKRNSITKLKSGDRGGAKLSHQFPLHPNNWRHFDHNDCSGWWCFCVCFFKYFLV